MRGSSRNEQKGSTLIAVLCVLMIVEILSLSLHFAVSSLAVSADKAKQKSQCRIMAISCLNCLEDELLSEPDGSEVHGSLREYLEMHKEGWEEERTFRAELPGMEWPQEAGSLSICLFWDRMPGEDSEEQEKEAVLCVEVTAVCKSQSFRIRQTYHQKQESGMIIWQK